MRILNLVLALAMSAVAGLSAAAPGIPTDLVVRAKARDAKFIGSSMGGARVRILDADTGKLLAEGLTEGATGNTDLIMKAPHTRYTAIGEGAASFKATLDIDKPVFLTIEVLAPHVKKQARVLATTQTWLVPGKPQVGDGLVVEVPGLVVDILGPGTHAVVPLAKATVEIKANVVMMCGCPLTPGGLWDANGIEVSALIERDGKADQTLRLAPQELMNSFATAFSPKAPGNYQLTVYAYDPRTGNTGVDQTRFVVTEK
jgi:hypothetical protein